MDTALNDEEKTYLTEQCRVSQDEQDHDRNSFDINEEIEVSNRFHDEEGGYLEDAITKPVSVAIIRQMQNSLPDYHVGFESMSESDRTAFARHAFIFIKVIEDNLAEGI